MNKTDIFFSIQNKDSSIIQLDGKGLQLDTYCILVLYEKQHKNRPIQEENNYTEHFSLDPNFSQLFLVHAKFWTAKSFTRVFWQLWLIIQ